MKTLVLTLIAIFVLSPLYAHEGEWDHEQINAAVKEAMQQAAEEIDRVREELGQSSLLGPSIQLGTLAGDRTFSSISANQASLGLFLGHDGGRLTVFGLVPGSNSERAGIKPGDALIAIDGERLENENASMETLLGYLATLEPGTEVSLTIERDDNTMVLPLETKSRGEQFGTSWYDTESAVPIQDRMFPPGHIEHLMELRREALGRDEPQGFIAFGNPRVMPGGFELTDLNEDLARYFNVDAGVLILKADPSSELKAGDVITAVDGEEITNIRQLFRLSLKGEYATIQRENSTFDIEIPDAGLDHGMEFSHEIEIFSHEYHDEN